MVMSKTYENVLYGFANGDNYKQDMVITIILRFCDDSNNIFQHLSHTVVQ